MANISVTNTFTNGTAADASQVNTNFTDIINGTSDGTKDFSISALTVGGTATFNGNINLGNSSADDITITGSLASSLPIKTNGSYDIGSGSLGLQYCYFGTVSTAHTARLGVATLSADRNYTIPEVSADASFVMTAGTQTITGVKAMAGTATNDSASTGYIGEYIESILASGSKVTTSATGVFRDRTSITLTAGDWNIAAGLTVENSGATMTRLYTGIGTASGDSTTGMTANINFFELSLPSSSRDQSFAYAPFRVSISSTTTYYLKFRGTYTVSDIDGYGAIWARRVR
jgi:hypothetical protein